MMKSRSCRWISGAARRLSGVGKAWAMSGDIIGAYQSCGVSVWLNRPGAPGQAIADRDIDPVALQIQQAQAGDQTQLYRRMGAGEAEQSGRQQLRGEGRAGRHRQPGRRQAALRVAPGGVDPREPVAGAWQQRRAKRSQRQPAMQALKHRLAKVILKLLDLKGQRGRGDVQFLGGASFEGQMARGDIECAQGGQGRWGVWHKLFLKVGENISFVEKF